MQTTQYDIPLNYPDFEQDEQKKPNPKPLKDLPLYKILRPVNGKLEILICDKCQTILYEDEFKIICEPTQVHPHIRLCDRCTRKNIWNNDRLYFTKGAGVHRIRKMKEDEELLVKKKGKTVEELQELKSLNTKICWGESFQKYNKNNADNVPKDKITRQYMQKAEEYARGMKWMGQQWPKKN